MKKLTLLLIVIAIAITANAQKVLTLHSNGTVTHYMGLDAFLKAFNAARNAGDTIYMPGAALIAPEIFNKSLVVFGAGHSLDSTLITGKTIFTGITALTASAGNSYFEGIEFAQEVNFAYNNQVNFITFRRCKFNSHINVQGTLATPSTNLALIDCVFAGPVYLHNAVNALLTNSIFQQGIVESQSNLISNNIFLHPGGWVLNNCNNNQILNNIFVEYGGLTSGTGNIYSKNLLANTGPIYGTLPTLEGNYTGVTHANIFVNQTGYVFNYAHNYRLKNPGTYPGTDGTQVGIYGGSFASKAGWVPKNPHIQSKNIAPQSTNTGLLNIQIQVGAQNN